MARPRKTDLNTITEALITRNAELMQEYSIENLEDLKNALGDSYEPKHRKVLMDRLSKADRILLRDFYFHECPAGIDRGPACIKVTIFWTHSGAWTPQGRVYITTLKAEFDRIKLRARYKCKTQQGVDITLETSLDEEFANRFFTLADRAWWVDPRERGVNAFDVNPFSVRCDFGDGSIRKSMGHYPDYHPYGELHALMQKHFFQLSEYSLM